MNKSIAKLSLLHDCSQQVANIFVHGYCEIGSRRDFERLATLILSSKPMGKIYLLYWKSGHWIEPVGGALVKIGMRLARGAAFVSPMAIASDILYSTAIYKFYEKRAECLGRDLPDMISRAPGLASCSINLIGHSLGARVIVHGLMDRTWSGISIQDCVFLGGAADLDSDWLRCAKNIRGTLYNAYSKSDLALMVIPDGRKRIGRHPIPSKCGRIANRRLQIGHTDYWPKLAEILPELWRHGES